MAKRTKRLGSATSLQHTSLSSIIRVTVVVNLADTGAIIKRTVGRTGYTLLETFHRTLWDRIPKLLGSGNAENGEENSGGLHLGVWNGVLFDVVDVYTVEALRRQ